jgi:hypothetical protein
MMKKIVIILGAVALVGMSVTATAAPPPKQTIMHCGCTVDGLGLEMRTIIVSSKGKGHRNHLIGSETTCYLNDIEVDTYTRTQSDCTLNPTDDWAGLIACSGPVDSNCGVPAPTL